MRKIPTGIFAMGGNSKEAKIDEKPVHKVKIKAFFMSETEISFAQYYAYCDAHKDKKVRCPEIPEWADLSHPVVNINKDEAMAFVRWLSIQTGKKYRLPTESEWEYAARGGSQSKFWWGEGKPYFKQAQAANLADTSLAAKTFQQEYLKHYDDKFAYSSPIGSFQANSLGLH